MKDYGITKVYRIANNFYKKKIPVIPKFITFILRIFFSATIPYTAEIGYGTRFPHGGQGVVINEKSKIGDNVIISAGVVIGGKKGAKHPPYIGNNVIIGANSTVIGEIIVGDNATIGAGSVVVKNVEKNSVVYGNPAKEKGKEF